MPQIKTGVLFLPPVDNETKQKVRQLVAKDEVYTNKPFGMNAHLVKIVDSDASKVFDYSIRIPRNKTKIPAISVESEQMIIMTEMLEHVDRLLIIAPRKIPVLFALVAIKQLENINKIKVIVAGKPVSPTDLQRELIQSDKGVLKEQWNHLLNKMEPQHLEMPTELLTTPSGATLRAYQQQIVDFVLQKHRVGLFVDMGLGKTLATLAAVNKLAETNQIDISKPILIVAPIMVALDTWSREAEKWGYDMDVIINIRQKPDKREALYQSLLEPKEKLTLLTTNPAQLKSMLEFYQDRGITKPFDVVIVDELSQFKSPTAKRFTQLQAISTRADYFMGLTGTPSPNNLLDVWSQLIVIDPDNGRRFGYEFFAYRNRFFEPDKIGRDGTVYSWKLKPRSENKIYQLMQPNVISMRSEGLIDLPEIVYENAYVTLPPKAQKIYNKMNQELRHELLKDDVKSVSLDVGNVSMDIANSGVLTGKLLQLTSGAMYDNILDSESPATGHYEVIHDVKFKRLQEIVENATSPILVFFFFQSELDRMGDYIEYEHLTPKRPDVQDLIARWNRGEVPVMVAHPASVGHGLNLQDGGHTMIWLTTTWSNEQYRQSVKRLYRSGQENVVSVIHIVVRGSEDENVIDRIDLNETGQDAMMRALDVADIHRC